MKNERQIRKVAEEAARIMRDYPHLKYYQAIMKAKEVLKNDSDNIQKLNERHNSRTSNMDA